MILTPQQQLKIILKLAIPISPRVIELAPIRLQIWIPHQKLPTCNPTTTILQYLRGQINFSNKILDFAKFLKKKIEKSRFLAFGKINPTST
jgi:hypothetical protein